MLALEYAAVRKFEINQRIAYKVIIKLPIKPKQSYTLYNVLTLYVPVSDKTRFKSK